MVANECSIRQLAIADLVLFSCIIVAEEYLNSRICFRLRHTRGLFGCGDDDSARFARCCSSPLQPWHSPPFRLVLLLERDLSSSSTRRLFVVTLEAVPD